MEPSDIFVPDDEISEEEGPLELMGEQPLQEYVTKVLGEVIETMKAANSIPHTDDYEFYEAFKAFPKEMTQYGGTLLKMIEALSDVHSSKKKGALLPTTSEEEKLEVVEELVETSLEAIDDAAEMLHNETKSKAMSAEEKIREKQLRRAAQALRPQASFKYKVDNSPTPFCPLIFNDDGMQFAKPGTHPYEEHIRNFQYTSWQLQGAKERMYLELHDTPCHYIDKLEDLKKLRKVLIAQEEFAVDLENHSIHSYQGFCCLMQISTRTEDYIIDALELRHHMHHLLAPFINPNILKVFHGSSSDMEWLQRDFGLYVVNMFDTGLAAQYLAIPHGLASLLQHFCNITVDKKYQTADWRQRPLSAEMLKYARQDTHYLLYLADVLRNRLLASQGKGGVSNPLLHVLNQSRELCLKKYEKPNFAEEAQRVIERFGSRLGKDHRHRLRAILSWRDKVAREEDESCGAVLPNAACLSIAEELDQMPLNTASICKMFVPTPPLLRKHVRSLVQELQDAGTAASTTTETAPKKPKPPVPEVPKTTSELCDAMGWIAEEDGVNADDLEAWKLDRPTVEAVSSKVSSLLEALCPPTTPADKQAIYNVFRERRDQAVARESLAEQAKLAENMRKKAAAASSSAEPTPMPQPSAELGDVISLKAGPEKTKKKPPAEKKERSESKKEGEGESEPVLSLREIYDLSAKSKKLRREKKKEQSGKKPDAPSEEGAVEGGDVEMGNVDEFLSSIGWQVSPAPASPTAAVKQGGGEMHSKILLNMYASQTHPDIVHPPHPVIPGAMNHTGLGGVPVTLANSHSEPSHPPYIFLGHQCPQPPQHQGGHAHSPVFPAAGGAPAPPHHYLVHPQQHHHYQPPQQHPPHHHPHLPHPHYPHPQSAQHHHPSYPATSQHPSQRWY